MDSWLDILRKVELSTADHDHEIAALKMQVAEALSNFEKDWPPQSHCVVAHEVMHICRIASTGGTLSGTIGLSTWSGTPLHS